MNKSYVPPKLTKFEGFRYPSAADFSSSDAGIAAERRLDTEDPRVKARPINLKDAKDWARRLCPELLQS